MLRYFRIDKPAQQKPGGRRLALQQLEPRLTLSATGTETPSTSTASLNLDVTIEGGFVNVGVLQQGFISLDSLDVVSSNASPAGRFSFSDAAAGLGTEDVFRDENLVLDAAQGFANFGGVLLKDSDFSIIPPPDPFPVDPGGGMVAPFIESQPFGPLPSEESVGEQTLFAGGLPQRLTPEIALRRGREVFFQVATLAPPQTLVRPDRIALGTNTTRPAFVQTGTGSPEASAVPVARGEQLQAPPAMQSLTEGSKTKEATSEKMISENSAAEKIGSASPPQKEEQGVRSTIDKISVNKAMPAGSSETATHKIESHQAVSKSSIDIMTEAEARNQVFADWRNRELIVLPLLVALVAGPRLVRTLQSSVLKTQQLPPKQNR